jgi:hypothetical protein
MVNIMKKVPKCTACGNDILQIDERLARHLHYNYSAMAMGYLVGTILRKTGRSFATIVTKSSVVTNVICQTATLAAIGSS